MTDTIAALNRLSQQDFVAVLGTVYEDTPAIAHRTWQTRPFSGIADLHQAMVAIVNALSPAEQDALIQAHPDLGSRARMAEASVQEQAGAGLDRLSAAEYERFQALNQAYKDKFEFPFIIAVKNHTQATILEAFEQRLHHDLERERQQALAEIHQIARFRLDGLILET